MRKEAREALDAYYSEGDSWAKDRNDELARSRRVAWRVAIGACVIAVCEALALLFLLPLKTVVPYTLLVDRQTGFVQALDPLQPSRVTADRALTQSFLVQYVIAREGFDIDSLQRDYRRVALWSHGIARGEYLAKMQATNPESPLASVPRSSVVDVAVKSVTSLSDSSAMVRFDTVRRDAGGQVAPPQPWIAVIRFTYTGEPTTAEDRMINPLGFKVVRYRRSAEALVPAPAGQSTIAPTPLSPADAAAPTTSPPGAQE